MPVVNPIIFKVTDVGRDAAAYAFNNLPGGKLSLSAIKVGLAKYSTVGNETSLQNPLPNTFSIGGGGVQVGSGQIRFTPILASLTRIEAFEIGLFTETGILFAVAATPTNIPLLVIEPDIEAIFTMNVALTNVDPDSIEIVVDVNAPLAVVMMGQHISAAHPHSQYKRTNDASERLKVANGVDNDEAVSKGQLSAEAATRAGVDSALAGQIAQEILDRQNADNAEATSRQNADNNEITARENGDLALSIALAAEITNRQNADNNLQNTKAEKNGNTSEVFNVAPATAPSHAITKGQFDAKDDNFFRLFGTGYIQITTNGYITIPPRVVARIAVVGGGGGAAGYGTGNGGNGTDSVLNINGLELCRAKGGLGGLEGYGTGSTPVPKNQDDRPRGDVSFNPLFSSIAIMISKNDKELVYLAGHAGYGNNGGVDRGATDGVPNTKGAGLAGDGGCLEFAIKNQSYTNDLTIDVVVGVGGIATAASNGNSGVVGYLLAY